MKSAFLGGDGSPPLCRAAFRNQFGFDGVGVNGRAAGVDDASNRQRFCDFPPNSWLCNPFFNAKVPFFRTVVLLDGGFEYMQAQRFWIERAFEDSKGSLGMGDFQLRKWRGWHHHMTLTLSAHLFLLRERIHNAEAFPLLSCQDIVTMLEFYLPKRDVTEDEIFRKLSARHRKRQDDIDRAKTKRK